jgi:general secretion pathway protein J
MSTRPARGFTLLELLVAVALMAVLAVLCWRGLDSVLRSRDRINAASDELRALTAAFTQMDDDLRQSWAVRLLRVPGRQPIRFTQPQAGGPIAMDLLRETGSRDERLRLQQVVYRLRDGRLERGFAPFDAFEVRSADDAASGANSTMSAPDDRMVWQALLSDVATLELRVWIDSQRAWVSAAASIGVATPSGASQSGGDGAASSTSQQLQAQLANQAAAEEALAVTGVEFTLARRDGGRIVRVFAVKD